MSKNFLKLFCISLLLFLASCAPRATAPPLFEERGLDEVISGLSGISRIDTTFSVIFEKPDSEIYGDGTLNISGNGDLEMKVYTLGFLVLELSSHNGAVKSNPGLDSTKKTILTQGLRDSIFWWDIKDFTVRDEDGFYLLRNPGREITLDKKNGLPTKQQIYYSNGKVLTVYYDNPAREEGILYQSKMKIELSKYSVTLTVKNIHFIMQAAKHQARGLRQQSLLSLHL
jgi:outer membrane lipoprotein-sorting protein